MNQQSTPYRPHIDGLRALSVLIILLFHLDVTVFKGGFIGVDIFFVISGYLITGIIAREMEEGRFSLANFYARRIKRIFPALFVMMGVTSLTAIIMLSPNDFAAFFKALRMASLEISNIHFARATDYFDVTSKNNPLLHTWSLGVEEQFYVIWPLLLMAVAKFWGMKNSRAALGLLLVFSLVVSEYLVHIDQMGAFYLIQSRAWELALGGLIALGALPRLEKRWEVEFYSLFGLLLILASSLLVTEEKFPGFKALPPCIGAALLLHALRHEEHDAAIRRILSIRPLVLTGLISYSLYLWHWPLIAFYKGYFNPVLGPVAQIVIAAAAIFLAVLSYRYIEQPVRLSRVTPRRAISAGLAVILVFVIGSNLIKSEYHAPWRTGNSIDQAAIEPNKWFNVCAIEGGAYDKEKCIIGPNKDKYEVILSGDSHAAHYIPTVLAWAKTRNLTVRIFLRGACRTWVDTKDAVKRDGKLDSYCMKLTQDFYKILDNDKSIRIIFLGQMFARANDDLVHSLKRIHTHKKQTYFLGDIPVFKEDPNECRYKNSLLIAKVFPRHSDCRGFDQASTDLMMKASHDGLLPLLAKLGIPYFDPRPDIATPYDTQGHFLYMDDHHLNQYGAESLTPALVRFMNRQKNVFQ